MIQAQGLTKEFASRILFQDVTFSVNKNERIGLVGRNGTGKSTLIKMITGEVEPDDGNLSIPKNYSIELLRQHIDFSKNTVLSECMQVLKPEEQLDHYKAEKILFGLGFDKENIHHSPHSFSGGYQIRITLAKCLLREPNLLLLDEPTNYLDIVSMRWLERFLVRYPGEIILITHDRDFMDKVCTHTMGIHRQKLVKVVGNYEKYWAKIQEDETVFENTRLNQEKKRKELEDFINRFRAKARKASQAQSRQKMLDKMEEFDRLEDIKSINFNFNFKDFNAKTLCETTDLSFGYDPQKILFKNLSFFINKGEKVAVIGKNGKGKSTLLNIIAQNLQPLQGDLNIHSNVSIGHFGQTNINRLHNDHTIEQEISISNPLLGKTAIRNICGAMMFSGDDAEKKISVLSGGEKSRVLLGQILAKENNLLLLDEPTNHLDQETIERLIFELKNFAGAVLIVTHSEYILKKLATKFIVFHHENCEVFNGSYDDFLSKIGWDEDFIEEKQVVSNKVSHKEYKQMRSDLVKQRSKETKPLRDKIDKLETEITQLEESVSLINANLIIASEKNDGVAIAALSKELSFSESKIDKNFSDLEVLTDQLDQLERSFDQKISEVDLLK